MDVNFTAGAAATLTWIWEKYGDRITKAAAERTKEKWNELRWVDSERNYRERVLDQVSTTLLLGYPKPIRIDSIYTDVHVLDQISAKRRFHFEDLNQKPFDFDAPDLRPKRVKADSLIGTTNRIFILGKPGAGKTTFLKYLALLACNGRLEKTPIYVSLKEWSDSELKLRQFIEKQFTVCAFPNATLFLDSILNEGNALILLDGLDEVNQDEPNRSKMIQELVDLAKQYPKCTFCVTCRIAATDYTFTQFTYVEIADFNEEQKSGFIKKWYQDEPKKLELFSKEWNKPDSKGYRELAQTPLLLALLCLAFDESLQFEKRRVDLYSEALDALLKKWDSTRGILRAEVYRKLSLTRKKQLLSRIAAINFQRGSYLFQKSALLSDIGTFLSQLPPDDKEAHPEPENILSAIEYQHGLLVERAHGIYSFSHLTFQEFFTAYYITENQARGTLDRLIDELVKDQRWREVFLMSASLLHDGTNFLTQLSEKARALIAPHKAIINLLLGADGKLNKTGFSEKTTATKNFAKAVISEWEVEHKDEIERVTSAALGVAAEFRFGTHDPNSPGYRRARNLVTMLQTPGYVSSNDFNLISTLFEKKIHTTQLIKYLKLHQLLIEALRVSWMENRTKSIDLVLNPLPPPGNK